MRKTILLPVGCLALALATLPARAHEWPLSSSSSFTWFQTRWLRFSDGFTFPFGGVRHAGCWIHEDGYVTLGGFGTDSTPSVVELLQRSFPYDASSGVMRIAPLWTNLLAGLGQSGVVKAGPIAPGAFRVTWENLAFSGGSPGNLANVALTLFQDGTFRFDYGTIAPPAGAAILVGFAGGSANTTGGEPASDLSQLSNPIGNGSEAAIYELFNGTAFDLAGASLLFQPVLPASGRLSLADNDGMEIELGFRFPFYGNHYSTAWVSSNGELNFTFRLPFTPAPVPATALLESVARICPYWTDLDPTTGGTILVSQTASDFTVAWVGVPERLGGPATFSVTLRPDGTISFAYGPSNVPSADTVVGVTGGWPVTNGSENPVTFAPGSVNGNGRQAALYEVFTFGSLFPLAGAPLHFNAFTGPSGLPLLDDTTIRYDFPPGFSFPIAGVSARTMFVHSNGNVTFGSGYGEVESGEDVPSLLFLFPRLAPLWNDFDPKHRSTGFEGQITLTQGAEDVTVDWSVPVYGTTNVNDFGVTLRADGTFSFRYGRVDSLDGIVGYSTGGFRALGSEPAVDLSVANPLHAGSETAVYEQFDGAVRVFDLAQRTLGWTGAYETIHRGRASPGATLGFALARSPADAGLVHVLGLSIGSTPGIPIDVRTLPLNVDGLLLASLLVGPPVFQSFVGTLDALGETVGPAIALPAVPGLVGVAPFVAWLTLDPTAPSGIRTISRATRFTIAP